MVRVTGQGLWAPFLVGPNQVRGSSGKGCLGAVSGDPWWAQGHLGEGYSVSFCPSDSPVGPRHREAGGQAPRRPQQVDHRPELGAPPCVSDTDGVGGDEELGVQNCPLPCRRGETASLTDSNGMGDGGAGVLSLCCCLRGPARCGSESCLVMPLNHGSGSGRVIVLGFRAKRGEVLRALPGQK